jgi:hypothetical protein
VKSSSCNTTKWLRSRFCVGSSATGPHGKPVRQGIGVACALKLKLFQHQLFAANQQGAFGVAQGFVFPRFRRQFEASVAQVSQFQVTLKPFQYGRACHPGKDASQRAHWKSQDTRIGHAQRPSVLAGLGGFRAEDSEQLTVVAGSPAACIAHNALER